MMTRRIFLASPLVFRSVHAAQGSQWAPLRITIPDTPVVDQHGRSLRFHSDLIFGRTVAINFIFTTCTTICTPLTAVFRKLQKNTAGEPVHLISISVDPDHDRPEKLEEFAKRFDADPNWTFVTGRSSDINVLLKALESFTVDKLSHTSLVLIGNAAADHWTRISGFSPAPVLAGTLREAASFTKGRS